MPPPPPGSMRVGRVGRVTRVQNRSAEAPLRANVRLLGEILGTVLAEQEGEPVLRLEERIRLLARLGRRGDEGSSRALAETIAGLDVATQAVVLRAFTMYFHLANIAEQHHRIRRRHELESEGEILRRLEEASAYLPFDQLAVSTQCGFASVIEGNEIDVDTQWRKLELVARVADRVWPR